ncbi:MAG: nitronate monooxygenase [Rhodospirillales bacterium]|nr:nitronate monooxygenase [Rhodospirillales bacterium]
MKALAPTLVSGLDVLPILEGGKGVSVSNGFTAGAFAAAGAVGTFSCVNADFLDADGNPVRQVYQSNTRGERFQELIDFAVKGGIAQARIAHDVAGGAGRIHMNVLWEAGGTEQILHGVLEKTKDIVHGVTCGAGMPYKVAEIAAKYAVYYYPIISSARAFRALWKRAYSKYADWLGGVVYEDPWLAGGHNGLSNAEDPLVPQHPYERVRELRDIMRQFGLGETPILMAGGVWYLRDWEDWIDNDELGPIVFQYGTRPILTQESPVSEEWITRYLTLKEGDVSLNKFSPTGFYSSAVNNRFLAELAGRSDRQVDVASKPEGELTEKLTYGSRSRHAYVRPADKARAEAWMAEGYTEPMWTPDDTFIFVESDKAQQIRQDQKDCMGCLSQCRFSNWADNERGGTGRKTDPRSFCIQKTLQDIAHGGPVDDNLMFAGHNAFKFASDPFYKDGFIPTVKQLVDRIVTGD